MNERKAKGSSHLIECTFTMVTAMFASIDSVKSYTAERRTKPLIKFLAFNIIVKVLWILRHFICSVKSFRTLTGGAFTS